jgi:hypothetical protein
VKGHLESHCIKKNPKKTPEWWKEKNTKMESASSSVGVMWMSLGNPAKD